jgi:hypothetical protein
MRYSADFASGAGDLTVKMQHVAASATLVQIVHILGDERELGHAGGHRRNRAVPGIRLRPENRGTAPLVPAPHQRGVPLEGLRSREFRRLESLPEAGLLVPECRDSAFCGNACAGEDDDAGRRPERRANFGVYGRHCCPHIIRFPHTAGGGYHHRDEPATAMSQRTGSANLPLHGGKVPAWLSVRMAALGRVIVEAIVHHYGRDELLRRLANPFWFQAFGAVMGMDWHSSGITTSVIGALKRGLAPVQAELGLFVCGGKGAHSRRTPAELLDMGERTGVDANVLISASRLVAKIDSAAVQDGYDLYLHGFFATVDGRWCVVQQGMNERQREARRYHWQSENLPGFFDSPHAAIEGRNVGPIINLADKAGERNRSAELALLRAGPDHAISVLRRLATRKHRTMDLFDAQDSDVCTLVGPSSHLSLPGRHELWASDIDLKRLHGTLAAAAERGPADFAELLLTPGVGARTVASLAFVAEVLHGAPYRFSDPARFSLAHGGKDGHPFPVPLKVYDETIRLLKRAVSNAKLGRSETLAAIRRLDQRARILEQTADGPAFADIVAAERGLSASYGGRTVSRTPPLDH